MNKMTLSVIAVAAAAGMASANTIDLAYLGTGAGRNVRITLDGSSTNVFAGQLRHQMSNGTGAGAELSGQAMVTYCADINQTVGASASTYEIVDVSVLPSPDSVTTPGGMGAIRAAAIQNLYAYANSMGAVHTDSSASNDFGTAFQLVVWELVYDFDGTAGSFSLTSGAFSAKQTNGNALWGSVVAIANDLFLNGAMVNSGYTGVAGLRSGTRQDQLVELSVFIPTPSAAAIGLVGLGGLAARRRR
jgi:hypothetical protein